MTGVTRPFPSCPSFFRPGTRRFACLAVGAFPRPSFHCPTTTSRIRSRVAQVAAYGGRALAAKRHHDLIVARTRAMCRLHTTVCFLIEGHLPRRLRADRAATILAGIRPTSAIDVERKARARDLLAEIRRHDQSSPSTSPASETRSRRRAARSPAARGRTAPPRAAQHDLAGRLASSAFRVINGPAGTAPPRPARTPTWRACRRAARARRRRSRRAAGGRHRRHGRRPRRPARRRRAAANERQRRPEHRAEGESDRRVPGDVAEATRSFVEVHVRQQHVGPGTQHDTLDAPGSPERSLPGEQRRRGQTPNPC